MMCGYVFSPAVKLTLIGTHVGSRVTKVLLGIAVSGQLTPEVVGHAIASSSTIRSYAQAEALQFVAVRVSMHAPQRMAWLVALVTRYLSGQTTGGIIRGLGERTLLYHITAFGMRGTIASALAAAAAQAGLSTCALVTSNLCFWRISRDKMSLAQYRYDLVTTLYGGIGTVVGGGVGAAVGTLVMPGFGTAVGSIALSMGLGSLPSYWRAHNGPDDRLRRHLKELEEASPLAMQDVEDGFVELFPLELEERPRRGKEEKKNECSPPTAPQSLKASSAQGSSQRETASEGWEEMSGGEGVEGEGNEAEAEAPSRKRDHTAADVDDSFIILQTRALPPRKTAATTAPGTSSSSSSPAGKEEEEEMTSEGTVHSQLRFSPKVERTVQFTSTTADLQRASVEAVAAQNTSTTVSSPSTSLPLPSQEASLDELTQQMGGTLQVLSVKDWAELDAHVEESCGADEMVFVFAVGALPSPSSPTNSVNSSVLPAPAAVTTRAAASSSAVCRAF